jgi:hypothetical protein
MENSKKTTEDNKKKGAKKSLSDLAGHLKTDGNEIHGGADVRVTIDVPGGGR